MRFEHILWHKTNRNIYQKRLSFPFINVRMLPFRFYIQFEFNSNSTKLIYVTIYCTRHLFTQYKLNQVHWQINTKHIKKKNTSHSSLLWIFFLYCSTRIFISAPTMQINCIFIVKRFAIVVVDFGSRQWHPTNLWLQHQLKIEYFFYLYFVWGTK